MSRVILTMTLSGMVCYWQTGTCTVEMNIFSNLCTCVCGACSCGHQKVKMMTRKQQLPIKLSWLMAGRIVGTTVDCELAELPQPNYDCYLISSYVACRPFLYVDGTSYVHA